MSEENECICFMFLDVLTNITRCSHSVGTNMNKSNENLTELSVTNVGTWSVYMASLFCATVMDISFHDPHILNFLFI